MTLIGEKIRAARKEKNLSQKALAEKLEISSGAVSNWETGVTNPSSQNILRIEEHLGPIRPQSISQWLYESRTNENMTMQGLSKSSGVSVATISNIENGRNESPRKETINKLAAALGQKIPEDSLRVSNEENTIDGLGQMTGFSPDISAKEEWPSVAGVYVLYDISDRPIYVGQSNNIAKRLKDHVDKFWYREPIVKSASYVQIDKEDIRKQVEKTLIKFLKSNAVLNQNQVDR